MRITTEMYEDAHEYMKQWIDDENWTDLNVVLEEGYTDLAAHILVGFRIYRPGDPFKMHCGGTVISGYNIDPATISKLDKPKYKICTAECKEEWRPE